jgi:uncharacterized repeat protein (TIGR01451 family)
LDGPIACPSGGLAPGVSVTCTASYTVRQADVDAGSVTNSATVTGQPKCPFPMPNDPLPQALVRSDVITPADRTTCPSVTSGPSTNVVTITQSPKIGLVESTDVAGVIGVSQPVTYTFVVTNTGNTTLTNLVLTDTFPGGVILTINCPATTLAVGASMTCTAVYTTTAADLAAGKVVDHATVVGTQQSDPTIAVQATSLATVVVTAIPATGIDAASMLRFGGCLFGAGWIMVMIGKRRRPKTVTA